MTRYARIEDNRVAEILELPESVSVKNAFHPDIAKNIKPCDPAVMEGFEWTGKIFQAPSEPTKSPDELRAYAAWKRYSIETMGIEVSGVKFDTSRESQSMTTNAYNFLEISGLSSTKFKASSGWVEISREELQGVAIAIGKHVQACFDMEAETDTLIQAGTLTTISQIDEKFSKLEGRK